jgi:hypothetical protein
MTLALSLSWSARPFAQADGFVPLPIGRPSAPPLAPSLAQIKQLQDRLVATGAGVDLSERLRHHFAPGMYGRELAIPGGMVVVGKVHRHQHFTLLLSGEATINTDRGMERITGPHVWVSQPGAKRALMTHTDCVFFTVHLNPDDTNDLALIEERTIVPEDAIAYEPAQLAEFADDLQEVYA